MKLKINKNAKERVLAIRWFENCGISQPEAKTFQLIDKKKAVELLKGSEWENSTLDARNDITGFLASHYSSYYQCWNSLIRDAKDFLDKEVISNLLPLEGFDCQLLKDCISWDLSSYLLEDAYINQLKKKYCYFSSLVTVYESGRIPCGQIKKNNDVIFLAY